MSEISLGAKTRKLVQVGDVRKPEAIIQSAVFEVPVPVFAIKP
jgi:hypothetical protein